MRGPPERNGSGGTPQPSGLGGAVRGQEFGVGSPCFPSNPGCSVSAALSQIPLSCLTICVANLNTTGVLLFSLQLFFMLLGG